MMEERAAGFWVRFAAFWFDTLIRLVDVEKAQHWDKATLAS
jgi:hypothetical protein